MKEPEFIRVLTTAIIETSMGTFLYNIILKYAFETINLFYPSFFALSESANNRWSLNTDVFINLQQLIRRFVDANEFLELQCLYAIQLHLHHLQYPPGKIEKYE